MTGTGASIHSRLVQRWAPDVEVLYFYFYFYIYISTAIARGLAESSRPGLAVSSAELGSLAGCFLV